MSTGAAPAARRYPYKARRLGRLVVTTCKQGSGAPWCDKAWTLDREGNVYSSLAFLLRPWRRGAHGTRLPGRALVVGWRK